MKYLVIRGRAPQDGTKAQEALLLIPKWMSSTLVCAGVVGRIQELTDGNIIEEGNVLMSEQETLDSLRIDAAADAESQQEEISPTPIDPNAVQPESLPNTDPHAVDNAYREGMQACRNQILGDMSRAGMPPDTRPMDWVKSLVTDLAEAKEMLKRTQECLEAVQNPTDYAEVLAKLQAAEDNLDAWRDAAGANPLIQQYTDEKTGRIKLLMVTVEDADVDNRTLLDDLHAAEDELSAWREAAEANPHIHIRLDNATGKLKELAVSKGLRALRSGATMNFTGDVNIHFGSV